MPSQSHFGYEGGNVVIGTQGKREGGREGKGISCPSTVVEVDSTVLVVVVVHNMVRLLAGHNMELTLVVVLTSVGMASGIVVVAQIVVLRLVEQIVALVSMMVERTALLVRTGTLAEQIEALVLTMVAQTVA